MSTKFRNLKNDLKDLENDTDASGLGVSSKPASSSSKTANYILVIAFVVTLLFYAGNRISNFVGGLENPIENVVNSITAPSDELLEGMGTWMTDMGYGELSREELIDLRSEGVTATFTSQIRDVGYNEVTLDQLVELKRADVSATYARMMKELGYQFTVEDLAETRRNGVTANFTSRMMDLGYTFEELTKDNLMRLRSVDVTDRTAESLIDERRTKPTIDELVRFKISNQ